MNAQKLLRSRRISLGSIAVRNADFAAWRKPNARIVGITWICAA
jgi:hypothetical protein